MIAQDRVELTDRQARRLSGCPPRASASGDGPARRAVASWDHMVQVYRTIDAHAGGQPVRLIVAGAPRLPAGRSLAHVRDHMRRSGEALRRALMLEPRGHRDMCGALLTGPVSAGAHAGVLFLDADGWPRFSGHALIGVVTVALERGLLDVDAATLRIDTPVGLVEARPRLQVRGERRRVDAVELLGVPSFVAQPGQVARLGARELRVDVAFGGLFHAIVDTEAIGIPLDAARLPDLRRLGVEICEALNATTRVTHPTDPAATGVSGVVFTGPPHDPEAHLRNVGISAAGAADRSPGVSGTAAVMAVLDAMGLLPEDQPFVHEGLAGALLRGRAARRLPLADVPALVPLVEGSAWITGEHTFLVDDEDPLRDGFRP